MRSKTILVATDFSNRASVALDRAVKIAKKLKTSLKVVHAINFKFFEKILVGKRKATLREDTLARLQGDLDKLEVPAKAVVEIGFPSDVITDVVRFDEPSILILGDHGEFGFKDVLLGTTARHIIEHATVPLLLIKSDSTKEYKKIILSTDFSESSKKAIDFACELFDDASFVLFHAYTAPDSKAVTYYNLISKEIDEVLDQVHDDATKKASEFAKTLKNSSKIEKTIIQKSSSLVSDIIQICQSEDADLLVMGTKGVGSLKPLVVGSVSESLLRHSKKDMLIFRS